MKEYDKTFSGRHALMYYLVSQVHDRYGRERMTLVLDQLGKAHGYEMGFWLDEATKTRAEIRKVKLENLNLHMEVDDLREELDEEREEHRRERAMASASGRHTPAGADVGSVPGTGPEPLRDRVDVSGHHRMDPVPDAGRS